MNRKSSTSEKKARGSIIIVSAPSGSGKTTLIKRLLEAEPGLRFSVSFTTRPPRHGERDGWDYFFVRRDVFERMIEAGEFVEWAEVVGHLYGTARERPARDQVLDGIRFSGRQRQVAGRDQGIALRSGRRAVARGCATRTDQRDISNFWRIRTMDVPQGFDSKFRFILVAAKRARQLQSGGRPLVQTQTKKLTKVAQMEVEAGLIPVEILEPALGNGDKGKKSKNSK
jgi:DNA-directed RNA polymerase omega subunit